MTEQEIDFNSLPELVARALHEQIGYRKAYRTLSKKFEHLRFEDAERARFVSSAMSALNDFDQATIEEREADEMALRVKEQELQQARAEQVRDIERGGLDEVAHARAQRFRSDLAAALGNRGDASDSEAMFGLTFGMLLDHDIAVDEIEQRLADMEKKI